jgi:hypothetical protein
VGEGDHELRLGSARILEVVKIAGGHVKHLAFANRKRVVKAAIAEYGDEGFPSHAVDQLVCIGRQCGSRSPKGFNRAP